MTAPAITIDSVSRQKIGKWAGVDVATVVFSPNQDLMEWEARADGSGVGQGLLVGEQRNPVDDGYALKLKNPWNDTLQEYGTSWKAFGSQTFNSVSYGSASFVVEDEELTYGDKPYKISVYGKNEAGEWTSYVG